MPPRKKAATDAGALAAQISSPTTPHTGSCNTVAPPAPADPVAMLQAALSAVDRSSTEYLLPIFNACKDPATVGITNPASLRQALDRAGAPCIPPDEADAAGEYFKRFDVHGDGCVTFDAFKRAVDAPDVLESWLDEGTTFKLGALAPALRVAAGSSSSNHDQPFRLLKNMSLLDDATIDLAVDASVAALKKRLKLNREELNRAFQAKERADAADISKAAGDRLVVTKMKGGNVADFYEGLAARVGFPSLDFDNAMEAEHCKRWAANFKFDSGNPYHMKTTPSQEWQYVLHAHVPDAAGNLHIAPEVVQDGRRERRLIRRIDDLRKQHRGANLSKAEVIAVILYSGPMFIIYNAALRQFPPNVFDTLKKHDNLFPTTIFVLASALQKLSRQTRIFADTPLFRGLGGTGKFTLELPDSFYTPDKTTGCTGYMDYGFQSFTADKCTAIEYSGAKQHKPSACILEIHPNSIDRAADISGFSQFPKEKEFTFVPCSFVQRNGDKKLQAVHWSATAGEEIGFLTVVPALVNANLRTDTIEQLRVRKKNMHISSFQAIIDETQHWMQAHAEDGGRAQARAATDKNYGEFGRYFSCFISKTMDYMREIKDADAELPDGDYVNDLKYKELVTRMLSSQAWAKERLFLWLENQDTDIYTVHNTSLKSAHRQWLSFLKRQHKVASPGSDERKAAAVKILQCKGLMLSDNIVTEKADGEPLIYASAVGWALEDLQVRHMRAALNQRCCFDARAVAVCDRRWGEPWSCD
jgi:hypothetical protein